MAIFDKNSTTDEVLGGIDLAGKRILVTGASAGLGVETVRALAARGATVIGAARDLGKARRALAAVGAAGTGLVELDLASLASVRRATDELVGQGKQLDAVIANAGVMACPEGRTADGFETQFGTNHLGHFVFINRLVPLLRPGSRVVILASAAHRLANVDLEDHLFEQTPYKAFIAYARSKTANVLYAVALDRRLKARGIRVNSVHPGVIETELGRYLPQEAREASRKPNSGYFWKTIPQGAATSVWSGCVATAEEVGGKYCEDCHVAPLNDEKMAMEGVRPYALDPDTAEALWVKSETLVGERFAF